LPGADASIVPPPTDGAFYRGALAHGSTIELLGAGFGGRPSYGPESSPYLVRAYDDCTHDDPRVTWDEALPSAGEPEGQMRCRTPEEIAAVRTSSTAAPSTPHPRLSRYQSANTFDASPSALTAYSHSLSIYGTEMSQDFYASFYYRADPAWHDTADTDGNHKMYDYSVGNGIYGSGGYYYFGFSGFEGDPAGGIGMGVNYFTAPNLFVACDDGGTPVDLRCVDSDLINWYVDWPCGGNGGPSTCGIFPKQYHSVHPRTDWIKIEYILRHGDSDRGFHQIRMDNVLYWSTELNDDAYGASPSSRTESIGGYRRDYGSDEVFKNNWSYFADVYMDLSFARVILANASRYDDATIVEAQPIRTWEDGRIELDLHLGRLPSGEDAWFYVFNSAGELVGGSALGSVQVP
jgi:hypothetical protein